MTTYNTYQEAKIANPECEIYQLEGNGLFSHCDYHKAELVRFVEFDSAGIKCNPADYCMTVEKFLAGGYRFTEGDLFIGTSGEVVDVECGGHLDEMHVAHGSDKYRYILRAAALEEKDNTPSIHPDSEFYKKPRTKIEYVKVDISDVGFSDIADLFFMESDGNFVEIGDIDAAKLIADKWKLHRRIETPMTEREAFIEAVIHELKSGMSDIDYAKALFDSGLFKLVN